MTQSKCRARYAALLMGVIVASSCDTRLPTSPGGRIDDVVRPTVKFSLSAGTNNTVEQGTPLTVTITATDDQGVALLLTSIRNGALVVGVDSVAQSPSSRTVTRTIPVPLAGLARSDKLTIRVTATDIGQNVKVDSIVVTVSDTIPPTATVSSTRAGRTLKGGDTLDVKVTAADSSGIAYAGYRVVRVAGTDTTVVRTDSAFVASGTRLTVFTTPSFTFVLPTTLLTGSYAVVGFALDRSGLTNRTGVAAGFTVIDAQRPTLAFQAPSVGGRVQVGDSILVRARITDNVSLARVTFRGASLRGVAQLGTADTVVRYPTVTAPSATSSFAVGTRDTVISRYLKVLTPIDTLADSLVVFGIVVDASNNADTARVAVSLVPGLSLTTDKPGRTVKTGETISVRVVAGDSAAVYSAGYRVSRVNAVDSTLVRSDSAAAPGGTIVFRPAPFSYIVPDTLSPGTYAQDPTASRYQYASPNISIGDLVNNASDRLFGVALDQTGQTLGVHGGETYFAAVDAPFTERLQGMVGTFSTGAGIAFHPQAAGITTVQDKRLAFVSSANGTIEAVDIAYYFNRATLATKTNLYGPLRASLPFAGDDPSVVLKLFGLSNNGLVVINLTAADIAAGPP